MPEFDFPGHALAFRRAFGFKTMSDPGVAEKAAALFEELCALAPREKMPFIHMGTDEVWKRDVEGAPRETLERIAKAISDCGRTMVSWVPGETYNSPGPRINMLWTDKVSPERNPGAYFDAIGMYIEDFDPFELLSVAVYHKAARWHDAGDLNQGAIFCAWHDGFVGLPYENLLRNQARGTTGLSGCRMKTCCATSPCSRRASSSATPTGTDATTTFRSSASVCRSAAIRCLPRRWTSSGAPWRSAIGRYAT